MKKRKLLSIVAGLALSMTFVVSLAGCGGTSVKVLFDRQNATLPTVSITTLEGLTNMDEISEMDPFGLILAHDDTGSPESPQTTYYLYNAFENKVVASYVRNAEYSEFDDFQSVLEGLYVYVEVNAETDELTYIYVSKDGEVKRTNTPHMGIIDEGSIMNYFSVTFEDGSSLYSSLDGEVVAGVAGSLNIKLPASFSEKVFFLPLNEDGCFRVWDKEGNFLRDVDVRAWVRPRPTGSPTK